MISDIADLAEELCDAHQHREPVYEWTASRHRRQVRVHVTVQPGLLVQLHRAVVPLLSSAADDAGGGGGVARSRPPLQLEAFDRYHEIGVQTARWAGELGLRPRLTAQGNIRGLVGRADRMSEDDQRELRSTLARWRGWAATMTGWQALYTPRATCPVTECGQRGLRINLSNESACCSSCGATWSPEKIGILAAHIAAQQPPHERVRIRSGVAGNGGWDRRHPSEGK